MPSSRTSSERDPARTQTVSPSTTRDTVAAAGGGPAPVREAAIALALGPRELLVHIGETADLDVGGADHAQRIAVTVEDHAQLTGPRDRLAILIRGAQAGGRPLGAVAHQQAELGGHPGVAAEHPGGVVAVRAGGRDERAPEPADAV